MIRSYNRYGRSTAGEPVVSFVCFVWQQTHVDAGDAILAAELMLKKTVVSQSRRVHQADDDRRRDNSNHGVTLSAQRQ